MAVGPPRLHHKRLGPGGVAQLHGEGQGPGGHGGDAAPGEQRSRPLAGFLGEFRWWCLLSGRIRALGGVSRLRGPGGVQFDRARRVPQGASDPFEPISLEATGLSPGAELLEAAVRSGPRLLGLTASYANNGAELRRHFEQSCQALQDIFRGRLHRCEVPPRPSPRFQRIDYVKATVAVEVKAEKLAEKLCERLWEQLKPALRRPKAARTSMSGMNQRIWELLLFMFLIVSS